MDSTRVEANHSEEANMDSDSFRLRFVMTLDSFAQDHRMVMSLFGEKFPIFQLLDSLFINSCLSTHTASSCRTFRECRSSTQRSIPLQPSNQIEE